MTEPAPFPFAAPKTPPAPQPLRPRIKVLVADDDRDVHAITKIALQDFDFDGQKLELLFSRDTSSTQELIISHPDIAVILLDVVMDHQDSGLRLVDWIRRTLNNRQMRIILRTGHPGDTPENEIIRLYDINDYKIKTELTQQKLHFALFAAIRSWKDITGVERNRRNLQTILNVGAQLFSAKSLEDFLTAVASQLSTLSNDETEGLMESLKPHDGFILSRQDDRELVVAATGRFRSALGRALQDEDSLAEIRRDLEKAPLKPGAIFHLLPQGIVIPTAPGGLESRGFVFIEGSTAHLDLDQLSLLMNTFSLAFSNFQLLQYVRGLQDDLLFTLSEVVEQHFIENANHVRRVSVLIAELARVQGWPEDRVELLRMASILHDIGKIAVPEAILKKPGPLSAQERRLMETHTLVGSQMLGKSALPLFQMASRICRSHHENWDGSGYPEGLSQTQIPLEARMMALVDVFDALSNRRCYKEPWDRDAIWKEMEDLAGKKFDPELYRSFTQLGSWLDEVMERLKD